MKLRNKTLVVIGMTLVGLVVVLYVVARFTLLSGFAHLEQEAARRSVERTLGALSQEAATLSITAYDWAVWDDTYAFVQDLNAAYMGSNLVDSTFTKLRLNIMLFVRPSGEVALGRAFNLDTEEEVPLPAGLQDHLTPGGLLLHDDNVESTVAGIIRLPDGPMLVAARPILPSAGVGEIRGTLVMGRFFDEGELERLAGVVDFPLATQLFDEPDMPSDFQAAYSSLVGGAPVVVRPLGGELVAGYALVDDVYDNPALVLKVEMPRDIYQQGLNTIRYFALSVLVVGLVFAGVVMLILERSVLSRVSRLSKRVQRIGATEDHSARVVVAGRDELSELAKSINSMLEALENSRRVLEASEKKVQELYESERRLRQKREAEISRRAEFIRALVHELKQPLTPMLSSSMLLVSDLPDGPLLNLAKNVNQATRSLNRRVDELFDVAKGELGMLGLDRKLVDLLPLLYKTVEVMSSATSQRGQSLLSELPFSLPAVWADEERLQQVLVNLLGNASKYTPDGGEIILRARAEDAALVIEIQDNGPGIGEAQQQRIFEPYQRGEGDQQRSRGLGLGLSLCKMLVELHGGRIWLKSQKGKGSTFSFSIPLGDADQRQGVVGRNDS